jgi:hypothetical protein
MNDVGIVLYTIVLYNSSYMQIPSLFTVSYSLLVVVYYSFKLKWFESTNSILHKN